MEQISIIIPVYNAEKYLSRCIESIISQSYENLEIILINDGSTDNSLEICDFYENQDKRIKVISIDNQGVSYARNIGIDYSTSKYIMFVDSDDWIDNKLLEKMSQYIKLSDLIVAGLEVFYPENTVLYQIKKEELVSLEDFLEDFNFYYRSTIINSPCAKIYKKDLLKEIRFDTCLRLGEDFDFNLKYLELCKSISVVSGPTYKYDCTVTESATKKYREGSLKEVLLVNTKGKEFCRKHNVSNYEKCLDEYLCLNGMHMLDVLANSETSFRNKREESKFLLNNDSFMNACKTMHNSFSVKTLITKELCLLKYYLPLYLFFRLKKMIKKYIKKVIK